jgi:tRNA(Ile)-lysidine synthase
MLENVESTLRDECGLVKNRAIIVGLSGGPDSLCLLDVLHKAGYPIIVAHFNHQLRPEADQEAGAVSQIAAQFALPLVIESADVRAHAEIEKLSVEEAARDLRYRFMFTIAHARNAQAVAVGHTADDQVETVLMHFLRGSGLAGLKGMTYRSIIKTFDPEIPIVRPLLDVSHQETLAYCAAEGLNPHHDPSNDSLDFHRNRIRHLLIPNLETYNPKFREGVLRMTHSLSDDHVILQDMLEAAWEGVLNDLKERVVTFDSSRLNQLPIGLRRNLIKKALHQLRPELDVNFSTLARACDFIKKDPGIGRSLELIGGLQMRIEGNQTYIYIFDADLSIDQWPQMPVTEAISVTAPGQIDLLNAWRFTCERCLDSVSAREQSERNEDPFHIWLDGDSLPESLELRRRLPGDIFEPLGMDGHSQKISDFMVNEKIPQRARDMWPLLCSEESLIWIPGYRPAHPFRLTAATKNIMHFSVARYTEGNEK